MDSIQTHERKLQEAVHFLLSDPSVVRTTKTGKRLQVLSPGRLNVHEGPDFLEIAILLDGMVIVGDGEFHRKTSDWKAHSHDSDKRYDSVILHIAFTDDDLQHQAGFEVLLLDRLEVEKIAKMQETEKPGESDLSTIEELQHYALLRLLRKTSEAQKLLKSLSLEHTLKRMASEFIAKYNNRRKRPVYTHDRLFNLLQGLNDTSIRRFLSDLSENKDISVPDVIQTLIRNKILDEGAHLRRELILNCVLPLSLCLAGEEARISLFLWFWSTPALHPYGLLNRRFKELPQNFLWQQQGMLEYIREHGRKGNVVSEAIKEYGFGEILSFYRLGRSPFREKVIEED